MTLAYTRDAGTGEKCRSGICTMSAGETPKKLSTSEVCFLCKAKVSRDEKIKAFGKSTLKIHSLILRSNLSVYIRSDLAAVCRSKCYTSVIVKKNSPKNLSADCRPSVDRQSADCWSSVGRQVGRLSAVCRPTGFARNIGYLSDDSW